MPLYEYHCPACGLEFEELVTNRDDAEYAPCKSCGAESHRMMSAFAPVVSGGSSNETIDMAVGRRANQRWQDYHDRQSKRHSGKEIKTLNLPKTKDGKYAPVMSLGDKATVNGRKDYVEALQQHRRDRSEKGVSQFKEAGSF